MPRAYTRRNRSAPIGSDGVANGGVNPAGANDGTGQQIDNGNGDVINPADIGNPVGNDPGGNDNGDGGTGKRRPRSDTGTRRGPRTKSAPLDLTDLKDVLLMAHAALAMGFRNPDIELVPDEAEKLASAMTKVARHYNIPDIASETKDWIGLIIVAGTIYGPRISASYAERRMKAAARDAEEDGSNVLNMTVAH